MAFRSNMFDLMFTESSTSTGSLIGDWSGPVVLDGESNNSGASCEIIEVDGRPAIGYVESVLAAAKYAIRF